MCRVLFITPHAVCARWRSVSVYFARHIHYDGIHDHSTITVISDVTLYTGVYYI